MPSNNVFIDAGFRFIKPSNITISAFTSFGHDNHFWAFNPIIIGPYVQTAKDLLIISGTHDSTTFEAINDGQPVVIEAGCWIEHELPFCTVLPSVKVQLSVQAL